MSSANPRQSHLLFSLPTELLEHIIVLCAFLGSPSSIAALSQTCRHFRDLVYDTADSHLWREVYLTSFDDPRPILRALRRPLESNDANFDWFDWKTRYQDNISAAKLFRNERSISLDPAYLKQSFNALLSNITTSQPHPPTEMIPFALGSTSASRAETCIPPGLITGTESLSTSWVSELLVNGYPDAFLRRLIGPENMKTDDNLSIHERIILHSRWESTEAGEAFHHLLFQTGFHTPPTAPDDEDSEESEDENPYNLRSKNKRKAAEPQRPLSNAKRRSFARNGARHRVYNLRYLSADRCWGPYLPFGKFTKQVVSTDTHRFFRHVINNLSDAFFAGHNLILAAGDEDEEDDGDYSPDQDEEEDDDDESNNHLLEGVLIETASDADSEASSNAPPLEAPDLETPIYPEQPHLLRPDYAYLSAARMVVEENLRERYGHRFDHEPLWPWFTSMESLDGTRVILERARNLDSLRMGGAPGFWDGHGVKSERGWAKPDPISNEEEEDENEIRADGHVEGSEQGDGWDWAGAAGKWMRAVSWMDYRDLLFHNLSAYDVASRVNSDIQETIRVFPMNIRITGYSRVPQPPALPPTEEAECSAAASRSPQTSYARAPPSVSSTQGFMSPLSTAATDGDMTTMLAELDKNRANGRINSDIKGKGKAKAEETDSEKEESLSDLILGIDDSSRPPPPYDPLVYALPVIHVTGEYVGSDVDETAQRRCRGTVRMIGDRAVRWTLITSDASSPDHDEWVMEGVQVGGIGSMLGVVGMWSGAQHEAGDPIGPSWAWKME